ncbi:single-stranded DNA-binding protein [Fusobacterium simiae]|uniref:Single-stranded DNA-binding protein n=1 Tax=Fusobacterium simiae TaxID=855 RepID=A0ABT4DJV4_FUSSI|nr:MULTISPECIES: single-stranded DNA-binding protein [Fusobacterium]MCY7007791.1 single-stranded DNA-binding protein [Fusobacterium simiae]MDC7956086.1 single-stranded DNA-binding protein [Fusobacterium simiae]
MNLVVLNGRLTRDPELKFGQSGKAYSRFSIAVERPFQSTADKNSQTADFINCVAFGKTAEFIGEYFRKGRKILLNGRLQMSQYESEGKKITTYVVIADSVEFGETKASSGTSDTSSYGHSENKSTNNNVIEPPVFDETSSDDAGTSTEIDDEFPF